jgi:hypothetical protein
MVGPAQRSLPQAGEAAVGSCTAVTVDAWFEGSCLLGFCSVSDDASWACWDLHNAACLKQVSECAGYVSMFLHNMGCTHAFVMAAHYLWAS